MTRALWRVAVRGLVRRFLCFHGGDQLQGIEDRDCGFLEIPDVSCSDGVHSNQSARLLQNGVLEIGNSTPQGLFKHGAIHGGNLEQIEESLKCFSSLRRGEGLPEQVVDCRYRCGTEKAFYSGFLDECEDLGGRLGKGPSVKEDIEHNVGIDQHPHEYFSRKCFL